MRYLTFLIIIFLIGCKPSYIESPRDYVAFLNDPKNGLIKEKSIAGIKFKLKYMPSSLTAYYQIDNKQIGEQIKDSIKSIYDNSLTFILNIGPADNEKFDITRVDISDYREFVDRIDQLAFQTQDFINLKYGDSLYVPAITRMESINGPEKGRNFIVVFNSEKITKNDLKSQDLSFIYRDEIFSTGVSKFIFKADDISSVPELKF